MALLGVLIGITTVVVLSTTTLVHARVTRNDKSVQHDSEFRTFCLLVALPGRKHGPNIHFFQWRFNYQLDKVGKSLFGNLNHEQRMNEAEKVCLNEDTSKPKCAYRRLAIIGNMLIEDLRRLENHLKPNPGFKHTQNMYINLLSAWYMDRVFLTLNCGPVNKKNAQPVAQWKLMAKWSKQLRSRQTFCTWSKVLHINVAKNLRQEVQTICNEKENEPICRLESVFDLVDKMENFCSMIPEGNWTTTSTKFKYLKYAAYINFYSLRSKMPQEISNMYSKDTSKDVIKMYLKEIFEKLYNDFRANDLSMAKDLLDVLPKSMYLPCDFTARFPSFEWLICSTAKSIDELRFYIKTYVTRNEESHRHKFLISNIDLREFIKNTKISQIKELAEKNSFSLQVVAADIQNNVKERFQQLGTYFRSVATFQQNKLNADVAYIRDRIEMYKDRFDRNIHGLQTKLEKLLGIFVGTSSFDLHQALGKMILRMAMAGNPLKWLFGSGNADEILESATEIAEASRLLTEAIRSAVHFNNLVKYTEGISKKINKNQKMIQTVKTITDNAQNFTGDRFKEQQSYFLDHYRDYSPSLTKEDLAKLGSYWDLFIGGVCDGIESSKSIIANSIRGIGNSKGKCREAKMQASQLVATQEEIYDLQFELMETMANLMGSITQIQSSKILGSGTRVEYPEKMSIENIKILMAISSMSYDILQTTNVENLCNKMEYMEGRRPKLCNGLATNIDKLLALRSPKCQYEFKYMTINTSQSTTTQDLSSLDLDKLYQGKTVPFQIPNSRWLTEHANILPSQRRDSIYVAALEIFMPIVSEKGRVVRVHVTPTNVDNKLREDSNVNYIILPSKTIPDISYIEGHGSRCRQSKIPNPYFTCGRNKRPEFPEICPTSQDTVDEDTLLPSIYSKFDLRLEGYEQLHISQPTTVVPIHVGIKICTVARYDQRSNYQITSNTKRRRSYSSKCCPNENQFFSERTFQCEHCPVGSKSYFNSLFCGEMIEIKFPEKAQQLTYTNAVHLCQRHGTTIASRELFLEARRLGQQTCVCGWLEDSSVDSLTSRNDCKDEKPCNKTMTTNMVHCAAVFTA